MQHQPGIFGCQLSCNEGNEVTKIVAIALEENLYYKAKANQELFIIWKLRKKIMAHQEHMKTLLLND